jgi:hypothetical protein
MSLNKPQVGGQEKRRSGKQEKGAGRGSKWRTKKTLKKGNKSRIIIVVEITKKELVQIVVKG